MSNAIPAVTAISERARLARMSLASMLSGVTLLSCVLACGSQAPTATTARSGDLVITDVTVVPMDREGTLPHHTVVVRGDRIIAVAPNAQVRIDPQATRIDGVGKWLMPGLADMHVHTWNERDLTLFVAGGVTTVRNMYGSAEHLAWRSEIAAGTRLGPTIVTASPLIDGEDPVWPNSTVLVEPTDADAIVRDAKAKGYDFLKPYSKLTLEAYNALVAAGKQHGMTLQGHVPRAIGLAHALASGQRTIEHLDGYLPALMPADAPPPSGDSWKRLQQMLPHLELSRIPALAEQTRRAGTWNCATLVVTERMASLDDPDAVAKQARWLHMITPEVRAAWDPKADFRLKSRTPEDFATQREANKLRKRIVAALAAGNAPLLVGTDAGNPYVIPGEAMHDEIELLVAAGVPRAHVLRAATADAGRFLGKAGVLGVVAVGARADLLLVGVDPLVAPIPLVSEGVVLGGRWLPKAELETKLTALVVPEITAPGSRWHGVAPLAAEGTAVERLHYELRAGGAVVGEERLAVGRVDGKRVIVSQLVTEVPGRVEVNYRIAGSETTLAVKSSFGSIALAARRDGNRLVATGKDLTGKDVALAADFPADAFLAAAGLGGSIELADKVAAMKPGERRSASSLELAYFPRASIEAATYDLVRKSDVGSDRVFAVTIHFGPQTVTSELVLDTSGLPVRQTFGPPIDMAFERVRR
ncbi:MAG: amidohydrolase family protein [Deltaproteobacteria bacterium]|nr:amidohydrolase family protein [Deltaproteobacteria bacterium]MDQ3298434.1 amidohydrolase family protein [Myxococcota bacterium]